MEGINFEGNKLTITLDELSFGEIPKKLWKEIRVEELTIQMAKPEKEWKAYPPLSYVQTIEFKEPFFYLPEDLGSLMNLRSINAVQIGLRTLPNSIMHLDRLESLIIPLNKLELTYEMDKLENLKSLKHLMVYGNHYDKEQMTLFAEGHPDLQLGYSHEDEDIDLESLN